jgi:FlaA1/EpsC-like NDP-sugar epimerase
LEQGVKLIWHAFKDMVGGEIYVKKTPSMNIMDIAKASAPESECEIIGIRPGEKLHEQMIAIEDAPQTYEYVDYYKILPSIYSWNEDPGRINNGILVPPDFVYSSENNKDWMSVDQLRMWISKNRNNIGVI